MRAHEGRAKFFPHAEGTNGPKREAGRVESGGGIFGREQRAVGSVVSSPNGVLGRAPEKNEIWCNFETSKFNVNVNVIVVLNANVLRLDEDRRQRRSGISFWT